MKPPNGKYKHGNKTQYMNVRSVCTMSGTQELSVNNDRKWSLNIMCSRYGRCYIAFIRQQDMDLESASIYISQIKVGQQTHV